MSLLVFMFQLRFVCISVAYSAFVVFCLKVYLILFLVMQFNTSFWKTPKIMEGISKMTSAVILIKENFYQC